jgi:hypothetical protein
MDRFGTYATGGTCPDADAAKAADDRRLRELNAADELDPFIGAGVNLAVDGLLDAVVPRQPTGSLTGLAREIERGAAMDMDRPDRFETR